MIPVLFKLPEWIPLLGGRPISPYGVMMAIAFLTSYFFLKRELERRKLEGQLAADIVVWAAIGGIIGSKVYYMVENYRDFFVDPLGMIFSGAGLVFFGGLLGGMLAVTILIKRRNLKWITFADIVAPVLMLGYAIGRIGCFLVGDDYGLPTKLPWGMAFENGTPPSTYHVFATRYHWVELSGFEPGVLTVHPTQIYEIILGLIIFGILWKLRLKTKPDGMLFFIYLVLAGLERFFIEFIRTNAKYVFGLSGAQIIALIMIGIGTFFILHFRKVMNEESLTSAS